MSLHGLSKCALAAARHADCGDRCGDGRAAGATPPPAASPQRRRRRHATPADTMAVPSFWDPRRRPERPDLSRITHHPLPDRDRLSAVQLCRAGRHTRPASTSIWRALICEEIKIACTDPDAPLRHADRRRSTNNRGDAVIASIAVTPEMRERVDFSDPYYRTPARFVARRDVDDRRRAAGGARGQEGRGGRRHRARGLSARRCSPKPSCIPIRTPTPRATRLQRGEVDLLFGDGISLAVLAQRHRLGGLLRIPRRAVSSKAGSSARASASRSGAATTCCGRRSTGRCSGCGRRAASPTCGCAISRSARFECANLTCTRGIPSVRARRS